MRIMGLQALEQKIASDLELLNYPPKPWRIETEGVLDAAIIGAGMAGLTTAFALLRLGVNKIQLFDENPPGKEGPWATYARMKTLRSPKQWMGPAMHLPSLAYASWHQAKFGKSSWETLGKIPTLLWMDYLTWYGKVLKLPIQNNTKLLSIHPGKPLELKFSGHTVRAHKAILATGRAGFGGPEIPPFMKNVPKNQWAHTNERIDFSSLKGKRIGIIGAGPAGFDAAATALDHHAKSVDLHVRRERLPQVNKGRELFFRGCFSGYYGLDDQEKWKFACLTADQGIPPPREALERIAQYPHFRFHPKTEMETILDSYDFLILATGLAVDGMKQPELKHLIDDILLWKDKGFEDPPKMGNHPYLGPSFEFLEKKKGKAPHLKNIYCFNYGSRLSHSGLGTEIPPISFGAERLAEGIAADFFLQDKEAYYERIKTCNIAEFQYDEFPFFHPQF